MDTNGRVKDLIAITSRLADVVERENGALASHERQNYDEILEEKATLGRIYETRIQALRQGSEDEAAAVAPDLRQNLKEVGNRLRQLIDENARLLKVAIEGNRRVVDLIAEAVKASTPGPGVYGAKGTVGGTRNRATPGSLPLSLDRSL